MTNPERKTSLELATYSLEGYRSTNWATSAFLFAAFVINKCANERTTSICTSAHCCICTYFSGQDRVRTYVLRREQIYSLSPLTTRPPALLIVFPPFIASIEPKKGVEPTTCWLQISCSTNWATSATYLIHFAAEPLLWQILLIKKN